MLIAKHDPLDRNFRLTFRRPHTKSHFLWDLEKGRGLGMLLQKKRHSF